MDDSTKTEIVTICGLVLICSLFFGALFFNGREMTLNKVVLVLDKFFPSFLALLNFNFMVLFTLCLVLWSGKENITVLMSFCLGDIYCLNEWGKAVGADKWRTPTIKEKTKND